MAKKPGDSKLAVAAALTLALALAGALLVKEPLRSSRPIGTGLDMKQTTGEQLVRARLWEDPLEAIQRGLKEAAGSTAQKSERSLYERVKPLRAEVERRVDGGRQITILLVTTAGGPYVESTESRIRDRYAVGTALGVACYVPEDEQNLSFLHWEPKGSLPAIPYEWYSQLATRVCYSDGKQADNIVVIWMSDEYLKQGFLATLTSLSQALVCQEVREGGRDRCALTSDTPARVRPNPTLQQHVTFKIIGPRSPTAMRALLEEARNLYPDKRAAVGIWPNLNGTIDLYSPWATAMKGLLGYGLLTETGQGEKCRAYEECESEFYRRLDRAGLRLVYDVGSDHLLFAELVDELERRQVRLGWDAVILIGEWDSFYGRALPIEFRAAACAKVATFGEFDLRQILVPVQIKSWCSTPQRAVDLQIRSPADYNSLTLNVFRYNYLSGLDGEVPGEDKGKTARADKGKSDEQQKDDQRDRPEGTSQVDYVKGLVNRIYEEGEGARAIGILGTDPYDSLLIIRTLRPAFPNAIFFTVDLDARYLHQSEYKWTRNMVIASPFGLQLDGDLQFSVPPFRSSYQTSTYFAALQAVGYVVCRRANHSDAANDPCTSAYHIVLTPPDRLYDAGPHPRIFEVGRHGSVDLSVVKKEGVRTVHPLREDLMHTDYLGQLKQGIPFEIREVTGFLIVCTLIAIVIGPWMLRNLRLLVRMAFAGEAILAVFFVGAGDYGLFANHDEGEPFSWTGGVSIWPTEILCLVAVMLCLGFFVRASRDLLANEDRLAEEFSFTVNRRFLVSPSTVWANLQRVYYPTAVAAMTADQAWSWYLEARAPLQRACRVLIMLLVYATFMVSVDNWLNQEFIRPCRGPFSCHIDQVLMLSSIGLLVLLNLSVFDEMLLCRRWIGWLGKSATEWPEALRLKYGREYGTDQHDRVVFEQLKGLACIDLIAQRTSAINRLIRYPFIALLVLTVARNNYFDLWSIPLVLIVAWAVNGSLALGGAYFLYQSADKAKRAVLEDLGQQLLRTGGRGKEQEFHAKQIQQTMAGIDANQQGAFVPLYQQPIVESSLYGAVALLQYLYLG